LITINGYVLTSFSRSTILKVLLFKNNEKQLQLVEETLNKQDYQLIIENDTDKLADHIDKDPPEMIISDFETQGGGIDLVNQLLAHLQPPFPYVLFITEAQAESYAVDCLGPIPGDFVSKPIREEELSARILVAERAIALQNHLRTQEGVSPDLAIYDDLTNLLNRQAVYERALAELNRAHRQKIDTCLALLEIINIDKIKEEHGEKIAHQAIRFVARAIRANIRMYDLVGRWMDAKFMLMLPGLPIEYTKNVIERIYSAISAVRIRLSDDETLKVEMAVGYVMSESEEPIPLYELIEGANQALIEATEMKKPAKVAYYPTKILGS
jgi:diguanylate cyclase (GGDEF)-like protein